MRSLCVSIFAAAAMIFPSTQAIGQSNPPTSSAITAQHGGDLLDLRLVTTMPDGRLVTSTGLDIYERYGANAEALKRLSNDVIDNGDHCVRIYYLEHVRRTGLDRRLNHANVHHVALFSAPWQDVRFLTVDAFIGWSEAEQRRCRGVIRYGERYLGWRKNLPLALFAEDQNGIVRLRLAAALERSRPEAELRHIYRFTREKCMAVRDRTDLQHFTYGMRRNDYLFEMFKPAFAETPRRMNVPEEFNESLDESRVRACRDAWAWFDRHPIGTGL